MIRVGVFLLVFAALFFGAALAIAGVASRRARTASSRYMERLRKAVLQGGGVVIQESQPSMALRPLLLLLGALCTAGGLLLLVIGAVQLLL